MIEDDDFVALLRSSKFYVAVHEVYELSAVALLEIIGVKRTVVVSAWGLTQYIYDIAGLSPNPSFSPVFSSTFSDEMTFWERKFRIRAGGEILLLFLGDEALVALQRRLPRISVFKRIVKAENWHRAA